MNRQHRVFAARWILPIDREPIERGWIRLIDDEVVEVGRDQPPTGTIDLEDVALLPGLVNAHTHLEFSGLTQPIGQPGMPLHQWIGMIVANRIQTSDAAKQSSIAGGLSESRAAGVRLIGEITTPPCEYSRAAALDQSDAPELIPMAEVLGLDPRRNRERLKAAIEFQQKNPGAGLSPHAPYSTPREIVQQCVELAGRSGPIAIHVAESPHERELLTAGTGPLADALQSMGVWRRGVFPWGPQPFCDLIETLSAATHGLLIHGNYLGSMEIAQLAKHPNLSVVYCPRTHDFFGHPQHPVAQMIAAGVRVALGTDSRASNPDLNLWREAQYLMQNRGDLAMADVLRMATSCGADALGRPEVGRIKTGCRPGLGGIRTNANSIAGLDRDLADRDYLPLSKLEADD